MGLFDSLFAPKQGPRDFNCARVYRGQYLADTNQYTRTVTLDFQVLRGEAVVKRGRPIRVYEPDPDTVAMIDTFYIYPRSPWVRIQVKNGRWGRRSIFLFREEDRRKSRMFKQRF